MVSVHDSSERVDKVPADLIELERSNESDGPNLVKSAGVSILDAILKDGNLGKPREGIWHWDRLNVDIRIRGLTQNEYDRITKKNTHTERLRKTQIIHSTIQATGMNIDLISAGCVEPNFRNHQVREAIVNRVGRPELSDIDKVIEIVFEPGEIQELGGEILRMSGFQDDEESITELKD